MDREPVYASRRAAGDERAVRLILRVMFRTLETMVGVIPPQSRALMRAGEIEGVDGVLPPHEDDLRLAVDLGAITGRNRVGEHVAGTLERPRRANREVLGECTGGTGEAERRGDSRDGNGGFAKELAPARHRAG